MNAPDFNSPDRVAAFLRRYAEHLERVKRALEEKRSVLITPLSESGCAVRLADTPDDHARLRDKRADMQPSKGRD